jgi:hypothetical protein
MSDTIELDVVDVGSNTLQGALIRGHRMRDINRKILVYNYDNMLIGHDELADDIFWLYAHGAAQVRLVKWIPERQKELGGRVYAIPRHRAKDR